MADGLESWLYGDKLYPLRKEWGLGDEWGVVKHFLQNGETFWSLSNR